MREISFVKKLKFNFHGSVTKRALVIGDADNDRQNELVCANLQGNMGIFKGTKSECFAHASNLGRVTACTIGDIINSGKNYVAAINMEGWLFIFDISCRGGDNFKTCDISNQPPEEKTTTPISPKYESTVSNEDNPSEEKQELEPIYEQRMPANCKELLLADLDGDGQIEVIIGLTDRVLRTYKWVKIGHEQGKFVGLYKWEFADQIGSVSLNPSRHENCQDIIVAQPGGTYAKLECFDKKPLTATNSTSGSLNEQKLDEQSPQTRSQQQQQHQQSSLDSSVDDNNVKTEYINKLTPEYHQLALAQMRNHHVSTEVLGSIKDGKGSHSYSLIVIATLDGTLMLVNKDEILWSLQVDHQLFALAVLEPPKTTTRSRKLISSDSTGTIILNSKYEDEPADMNTSTEPSKSQHFVACAWNGKTYIIDEERNYLRFKFGEAVSAFTAGNYYFDNKHHSSLVYATFNNQIILYYDVLLDNIRPMYLLKEIMDNPNYADLLDDLTRLTERLNSQVQDKHSRTPDREDVQTLRLYDTLHDVLYNLNDTEASQLKEAASRTSASS